MKLLTDEIRKELPRLYETEKQEIGDKIVFCKFFNPMGKGTWYVLEGSKRGEDFIFFGLIDILETEFGYFSLRELEELKLPYGMKIERDINFEKIKLKNLFGKEQ